MSLLAHGIVGRADLPIPEWLFGWAAAMVLVISFVALAVLWPRPRLQDEDFRPLPGGLSRVLTSRAVELLCGAVGVALLVLVVWSGLSGIQTPQANFAPTFVFVIFWLGFVPLAVLFGDVFRAFNPWRAIGRAVAWVGQRRGPRPGAGPDGLPGAARPLARGRGAVRVRGARAGGVQRRQAGERGDRGARLLGRDLRGHGPLRRRGVVRARRGVRGLLQPVLAHLALLPRGR